MSAEQLRNTVKNILLERRNKFDYGVVGKAEWKYQGCITALNALISTGSVKTEEDREIVDEALDKFYIHMNLGVIVDGTFKPICPAIAARWDIVRGSVISANKLPVLTEEEASDILADIYGAIIPKDWIWDEHRNALIHLSFYYRRYPEKVLGLKTEDVTRLGLRELFKEQVGEI